jgi:uncharacterized protein (DUF885 family)
MKRPIAAFLITLALVATTFAADGDAVFAAAADQFIAGYLAWRPGKAVELGLHDFDGKVADLCKASIESERERLQKALTDFEKLDPATLSASAAYDCAILRAAINRELFRFDDQAAFTRNPMTYASAVSVLIYIQRDYAPLEQRVRSIIAVEHATPKLMANARENLSAALPRPFILTAIENAEGAVNFFSNDLVEALKELKTPELKQEFQIANQKTIEELKNFVQWLKTEKLPKATEDFALGTEKYQRMITGSELINLTPEQVLAIGLRELKKEQERFASAAKVIDPAKDPRAVFQAIKQTHPSAESLIPEARAHLEGIYQFLIDHKIVSLPSDVRVTVEETPKFRRTESFAMMDPPGPFDQATSAFYYITPVEKEWPVQQQNEWLTQFNPFTLDGTSIHEAYPGHYVQFLHLHSSHATKIEKVFDSYAYTEGWAHYCEQMLVEEGYGQDKDAVTAAKYRMAQSGAALLRLCRLCVSIQMHCQGKTIADGTKFFEENCYYDHASAKFEATRGSFDPGYLNYTLG